VVLHPGFVELEFLIWQFFDMVLHRCAHEASSALDRLERPISKGPVRIALPFSSVPSHLRSHVPNPIIIDAELTAPLQPCTPASYLNLVVSISMDASDAFLLL
jgi:hypothetical protein